MIPFEFKIENVENWISFYCDDGLESIKYIQLDTAIIAGMGWRTITSILDKNIQEYYIFL